MHLSDHLPGILSFYVWTGLPAPHNLVVSDGINWLRPKEHSKIQSALVHAQNTCLITNPIDLEFWESVDRYPSLALAQLVPE